MKKILTVPAMLIAVTCAHAQSPAYTRTAVISGLQYPVAFDVMPNGNYLLTQKGGNTNPAVNAQVLAYSPSGNYIGIFYDLTDSVDAGFERGLLGICLDPNFSSNHYVYAYYVHLWLGDERLRVVRFTENNNVGTNPFIVFDWDVPDNLPGNHVGGNVHMHASEPDKLYFSIGDLAGNQYDTLLNYAHMLSNPYGKILRIKTDGSIPTDNPFYDGGDPHSANCDLIWSYGLRNPFDFCFSPVNGSIYCSENGDTTWDETDIIMKGKNYGWNVCEGMYLHSSTSVPCNHPAFVGPLTEWGAPLGAVTGILVYSGTVFTAFDNHLLVADNNYGRIYDCTLGNAPYCDTITSKVLWTDLTDTGGLTTLKQGSDGCIYAMEGGYTNNGKIYRVCPQGMYVGKNTGQEFFLQAPYPNPSRGRCALNYTLKKEAHVEITLHDISGRKIATLCSAGCAAGSHTVNMDQNLEEGVYFCAMRVQCREENFSQAVKVVVVK